MTTFYHEEQPNGSKRCKYITSTLKDAFTGCHTFRARLSSSPGPQQDEDDDEQEMFVSAVLSRYMESKARRKGSLALESCSWAFDPSTGEFSIAPKTIKQKEEDSVQVTAETEDFYSVCSCFSYCSNTATNMEAFVSVRSNLSECSSLSHEGYLEWPRRSIILEFCHCEGWPFGLCRRALLLPPLPKSPSESWLWCKSNSARMV
ncbi:hypothetical protein DCAR_0312776 [Daucus carota subsp. sativus]|uniref:Uncharacterized protein n=1 Tax=Daucus carota subsp. sativus TaxID=79200 RepID=A0AAF0WPN6_DAUCS|nr:PREDICTED: uncharacterized protein LOC108213700 [Daucus carota subsp. sativus]WOG93492.1 hypothetical protein DCAR_0312776 [Daucus carota subsp. sativus]